MSSGAGTVLEAYAPPSWAHALANPPAVRVRLARLPTPIEPWRPPDVPEGLSLRIKRDDLTGVGLTGNKVRKLEFLLADAQANGCDTVITCGGIQSNHARATALAACRTGMRSVLFLRTREPANDPGLVGNLLIDRLAGASIRWITPEQYADRSRLMQEEAETLTAAGRRPYVIPEGGSNALGSWGYVECVREVLDQVGDLTEPVTDLVVALGSGGTTAGLAAGLRLGKAGIRMHAVNVCDDAEYFYRQLDGIGAAWGLGGSFRDDVDIIDGHVGRGYALSTPGELARLRDVARTTGILLDPVYTGKAWAGLAMEWKRNRDRFQGNGVLFIHTGGIFGLYAEADALGDLL